MKHFFLFAWPKYDARGGMADLVEDFDSAKEAVEHLTPANLRNEDVAVIFDTETRESTFYRHVRDLFPDDTSEWEEGRL